MAAGDVLTIALPVLIVALDALAVSHAVLHKHDTRAAIGWVGVILSLPLLGAALYWALGINRVRRRAAEMFRERVQHYPPPASRAGAGEVLGESSPLAALSHLIDGVTVLPLTGDNSVTPLENGDEAYPAMLRAIEDATRSIALATYIFDSDRWGSRFVAALARARARGVEVRVLVDAVGARYSFPSIIGALHHRKLRAARFNRTLLPWRWTYANLRNHRKLLICDGRVGFTGGLNIRAGHVLADAPDHPVLDLHFRVAGPVVAQMTIAFAEDWSFATGERLAGPAWFPRPAAQGEVFARAIIDGPDADLHKLRWTVIAAIISARRRVRIVTPYFLPENDLVAAMKMASLRGVEVQLVLPANNNQILVKWACDSLLHQVLECGVSVYKTEGPFDHAKVMVVDDSWTLFGSANLDPRSLRLNFELDIEAYDEALAARVHTLIDARLTCATRITREALLGRGLARRLRDGVARLFIPYL